MWADSYYIMEYIYFTSEITDSSMSGSFLWFFLSSLKNDTFCWINYCFYKTFRECSSLWLFLILCKEFALQWCCPVMNTSRLNLTYLSHNECRLCHFTIYSTNWLTLESYRFEKIAKNSWYGKILITTSRGLLSDSFLVVNVSFLLF